MTSQAAEKIARAVLYEGYLLYPYTPSATKNQQRWTFGGVYPKSYAEKSQGSDLSEQQTECLVVGHGDTRISVRVRFLHLIAQYDTDQAFDPWEEAVEREVIQSDICLESLATHALVQSHFVFDSSHKQCPIHGALEISAEKISETLEKNPVYRLRLRILNKTDHQPQSRSEALLYSMISTHSLLSVSQGAWISLMDPPAELSAAAACCKNIGTWPVLVGEERATDMMLSSPIILYDYPQIAPESPGDLFDGAEIDEILSLRILTLSEEEKAQIRKGDGRACELLERTENLTPNDLLKLHGRLRDLSTAKQSHMLPLKPGVRVRIRPKKSADIFDIALKGMTAIVESVEQDLDGKLHMAVTLEDDPGRDLGMLGQPGHRFFFSSEELEPI